MTGKSESNDERAILGLIESFKQGHHDKNAAAVAVLYAPDATIFDLAPPLGYAVDREGLEQWFATKDGPIGIEVQGLVLDIEDSLATGHGYMRVSTETGAGAEAWWMRFTMIFRRQPDGAWRIAHDHSSVPFYMDKSARAALDLVPD
jgi:uncharacterized protein (TIGR02246 family)